MRRYDRPDSPFIYPGRSKMWDFETSLYEKWEDGKGMIGAVQFPGGAPRHWTFFFTLFVLLQIVNMLCSRKIHDELNIFKGMFDNWVFLAVWVAIIGL